MDYSNNYSNSHTTDNTPVRGPSPALDADQISSAASNSNSNPHSATTGLSAPKNPFMSPWSTRPSSFRGSASGFEIGGQGGFSTQRYFHSRRVKKGEVQRPWLDKKDPREKWTTIIPLCGIFLGLAIAGFLVWDGMRSVVNHQYCQILDEDWSHGFDTGVWTKESEVGGFGNGQFEQSTNTDENVFIQDGSLWIKPTLQDTNLMETNNVINLTSSGSCTSDVYYNCVAATNVTNGTVVPPVKSGRINTLKGATIKYGKIEVTAQMPVGDWMWPAIWMLPVNSTYGEWPRSGEIDIAETRGNNYTYAAGGNNIVSSALHWGPDSGSDAWWRTNNKRTALHTTYSAGTHVFGVEWSEKYIFTYVDTRLLQVLYFDFTGDLYARGGFPLSDSNGTTLVDPWSQTGNPATPFDQDFYLILNVAVGSTNGWFPDGQGGKPWVDASPTARKDFWRTRGDWYPTWANGGQMVVHSVKMWQQKGYRGC